MEQWRSAQRGGNTEDISHATELLRESIAQIRELKQSLEEQPPKEDLPRSCVSLLSALVDLLEIFTNEKDLLEEARALLDELVLEDPVRRKYWQKRLNLLEKEEE